MFILSEFCLCSILGQRVFTSGRLPGTNSLRSHQFYSFQFGGCCLTGKAGTDTAELALFREQLLYKADPDLLWTAVRFGVEYFMGQE
jgi:hypothetical protein